MRKLINCIFILFIVCLMLIAGCEYLSENHNEIICQQECRNNNMSYGHYKHFFNTDEIIKCYCYNNINNIEANLSQ